MCRFKEVGAVLQFITCILFAVGIELIRKGLVLMFKNK